MSKVISQTEIQKFRDNEEAVFPAGTIITPSALDWAKEHNIKIVSEGEVSKDSDREDFLRKTVETLMKEFRHTGMTPDINMMTCAVKNCLEKLGCKVKN